MSSCSSHEELVQGSELWGRSAVHPAVVYRLCILFMYKQPPKELLDALMSPREEVTDVLPSSCLCSRGANYRRGFPWPTTEEGYPASELEHHNSASMEQQEMSLQRVEACGLSHPSHKHPKRS